MVRPGWVRHGRVGLGEVGHGNAVRRCGDNGLTRHFRKVQNGVRFPASAPRRGMARQGRSVVWSGTVRRGQARFDVVGLGREWAYRSVVDRFHDTEEAEGSIPSMPTWQTKRRN